MGYEAPLGYVQVTSLAAAVAISGVPNQVKSVLIQAETQNVRWRDDGVNPTAAVGMLLAAGDTMKYNGNISALKFIEVAASAKLNVSFY